MFARSRRRMTIRQRRINTMLIIGTIMQHTVHRGAAHRYLEALRHITLILVACNNLVGPLPETVRQLQDTAPWTQFRYASHGWRTQPVFEIPTSLLRHAQHPIAQLLWLLDNSQTITMVLTARELIFYEDLRTQFVTYLLVMDMVNNGTASAEFVGGYIEHFINIGNNLQQRRQEHLRAIPSDWPADSNTRDMQYYQWMYRRLE